jgi:DNA-binding NtrC family response regulator
MRTALRADAAGQEIVEQFVRLSDHGGSMASLFGEFMPRMLNYIDADRGFIARFTSPDAREYEEVAGFGLSPEEQIKIADETFVDRLLLSEVVQDRTTLLVPIASAEGVRGFFCMDRRTARVQPFSSEHTSLLLRIGELAAQCYESNPSSDHPALSDDVKAWPLGLIGNSKPLNDLQNDVARVAKAAKAKRNVLVLGETGTGKQLVADALHRLAYTKSAPEMVERDCAAIPESLAETELFGSEKGAFTGSIKVAIGMFELAQGTSLFLDEIQALPHALQHKLFRVLVEKKVWRVGARRPIPVDVFVIAAIMTTPNTGLDAGMLERALLERFGEKIYVPPLRERREDIPLLVFQFIDGCAAAGSRIRSISHRALELLMKYDWPGNVRELKNLIENVALRGTEIMLSSDLPPAITAPARNDVDSSEEASDLRTLAEIEKAAIQTTLARTSGNIAKTARILDIAEMSVRNKMKTHDIPAGYGRSQK